MAMSAEPIHLMIISHRGGTGKVFDGHLNGRMTSINNECYRYDDISAPTDETYLRWPRYRDFG